MKTLTQCPLCGETNFEHHISCVDETVSHETFDIVTCRKCTFTFTNPVPENLGRYYDSENYISHNTNASTVFDRIYQLARTFTIANKEKLISKYATSNRTHLDFGCGTGHFIKYCKSNGWKSSGVEPTENARLQAQQITGSPIASHITEVKDSFSVITLWHVLEHVPDIKNTLDALASRLDQTGTIFIAVPNYKSMDSTHYRQNWAAYDVPRHLWHFSQTTMTKLLNQHSLKIKTIEPMKLDAYYVSLLSEKYRAGKTGVHQYINAIKTARKSNSLAKRTKEYSSLIYIAGR